MLYLITRRIAAALVTLFLISIVAFIIIQLPPGDFVDAYAGKKTQGGVIITQDELDVMRIRLGMDKPLYQQYFKWIGEGIWDFHGSTTGLSLMCSVSGYR